LRGVVPSPGDDVQFPNRSSKDFRLSKGTTGAAGGASPLTRTNLGTGLLFVFVGADCVELGDFTGILVTDDAKSEKPADGAVHGAASPIGSEKLLGFPLNDRSMRLSC
jgi:hypothetical protein